MPSSQKQSKYFVLYTITWQSKIRPINVKAIGVTKYSYGLFNTA